MAITDLISQAKKSRLGKAISNVVSSVDRDKEQEGFQFTAPNSFTRRGVQRVQQSFREDPGRYSLTRGFSNVVPATQIALSPINYLQGKAPSQFAQDVAYGLRGATQLTPFQAVNYLGIDKKGQEQFNSTAPTTDRQKTAQQIGRATYGAALTAPVSLAMTGGNLTGNLAASSLAGRIAPVAGRMALRASTNLATSAGVGAGLGAGISALTGGDVKQGAQQGALSGYSFAPLGAITNPVTERVLRGVPGALQGQLGQRAIAGIANVIEDELQGFIDGYDTDTRSRITSLAIGAVLTGNDQAIDNARQQLRSLGVNNADQIIQKTQSVAKTQNAQPRNSLGQWARASQINTGTDDFRRMSDIWAKSGGSVANMTSTQRNNFDNLLYKLSDNDVTTYNKNLSALQGISQQRGPIAGQTITNVFGQEIPMPPRGQAGFFDVTGKGLEPTDQLIQEARKYKSAEEFIQAQPNTWYHGSPSDIKSFEDSFTTPTFLTKDKKYADVYTYAKDSSGKKGNVLEVQYKPENTFDTSNPKDLDIYNNQFLSWIRNISKDKRYVPLKSGEKVPFTTADNLYSFLRGQKSRGNLNYDSILVNEGKLGGDALVPLNASQIKTKSQLTDIYNQANNQTTTNIFGQTIPMPDPSQAGFIDFSGRGLTPDTQVKIPKQKKLESSRTRIERKEKASPKLRTFQGKEIEQTGLKLPKKQAELGSVSGKKSDSSSVIISRDKKYSFNINKKKLGLNAQQSKQLDDVVEVMRPVLEKNKGKTLTKNEIIEGGRKAKVLEDVVGREEAKAFADSLQASRNLLRSEQSQVGITPKFLEQLEIVSSVAADAGRRLQAFNIGAEDITIKEKLLRDILKTGATAEEVLKAGRKVDWDDAKQVTDFYRKFKPATFAEKLDEFRYTNMLSSPNTHINNAFSNFLQTAVLAPIEKTVRGTVDFAQSKLTGKEQEYFARQGVDYARGYWKALPEAIDVFRKTLAGVEGLRKPDVEFIPTSTSKLRQIYTLPLQALEASDQFFRTLIRSGEIESLKTEGITGAKASKIAEQQADYRVFRQAFDPDGKLGQNKVLQVWDKWNSAIQNLRRVPGGSYLVPFLQTPTNILKQGFEYSPLGVFTVRGSANPQEQLAKTIIGSGVFTAAYALANSGLTTWDTPTNSTQRSEFYAAGLQPYSVKIGDKWVSYSKLGPLAYPIAMASALKWAQDNGADEDQLATIGSAMAGTLGFFADQSYVRGIGDMIDAFRGDEYKQARAFGNIPSQMIPYRAAMGWIARLIDPVYRKASGGTVVEQIGKGMISQIPFASRSLEAYETPFGTESQRQFPGINAFSPLSISQERPEELEYFNARQSIRNENKKVDKILEQIEAGKDVSVKELDANKLATKQAADLTKKKIEAGIEVTQQELETAYLNKPLTMPKSNRYEKSLRDSELWSKTGDILRDENLSDAQKSALNTKIATELGVTPQDIETYQIAKQDNAPKTLYVLDQIDKMQSADELIQFLSAGRKPVNGKILISDGVITNLVNDGLIPEALGKQLKNLDLNEDGTVKKKKASGGGKAKKSAQDKALERYLDNLAKISLPSGKIRTQAPVRINTRGLTFEG